MVEPSPDTRPSQTDLQTSQERYLAFRQAHHEERLATRRRMLRWAIRLGTGARVTFDVYNERGDKVGKGTGTLEAVAGVLKRGTTEIESVDALVFVDGIGRRAFDVRDIEPDMGGGVKLGVH